MYRRILIPIDIAQEASWRAALPIAMEQARLNEAELHVMAVAPETPPQLGFLPADYGNKMIARCKEKLDNIVGEQISADFPFQQHIKQGSVYKEILALAQEIGADLIIMASHQPGLENYLLGPNSARVVRHASCSVMVVRE